ncbi:tRNA (guanine-N1)-methyltransferase [Tenacibaculum sp. IB213877]|uniref:tRNA (guanine-N1)-methyltransferase n=1 Tax=Tenacibaculum sp. IB213877 TaxID=3097351 RepID=UPI002A59C864|nr:tRNA (guanine-N1)-methyltransferase [Tenacibaculum sp. IB213877]MDY0780668.1 tRNA (guanine-N1)-methyltransferase [Tenacibaculum sp. IB213877]
MKFIKLIILLTFTSSIIAQTRLTKAQVDSLPNTIENQFIKVYRKASNWQEYKMIKRTNFLNFQKNVLDSVATIKNDSKIKLVKINEQEAIISSLNTKISELNNNLSSAIDKEDRISFLGIPLTKVLYNTIVWGIILVLLSGLFFFLYKFNNSNILTKQAQKSLLEVEQDFEQHRKKAIEREQKLRRQLQDEINKQRGI